ncbi:MAG: hypothetical protein IKN64_07550 [Desulfovibrio sp.]|nr:hypothetical protein [Desulfovibrio sp.]
MSEARHLRAFPVLGQFAFGCILLLRAGTDHQKKREKSTFFGVTMKREKTKYPGITFREIPRLDGHGTEKLY